MTYRLPFLFRVSVAVLLRVVLISVPAAFAGTPVFKEGEAPRSWQLVPLPVAFYTSDTGVAGGGLLVAIHQDEEGRETFSLTTAATLAWIGHAELSSSALYRVPGSPWKLEGAVGAFHTPATFYGPVERDYLLTRLDAEGVLLRRAGTAAYLGALAGAGSIRYADLDELERESGSNLRLGTVLRYDTRDNPRYPRTGTMVELRPLVGVTYTEETGDYRQVSVDLRRYVPLYRSWVLAVRSTAVFSTAETPRHARPSLGGYRLLRGYAADRFTARHTVSLQSEVRVPIVDRLTLVAFGAGGVAEDSLDRIPSGTLRYTGGGGVRFAMNRDRDVNIRLDTGFSPEGMRVYLTLMEAF